MGRRQWPAERGRAPRPRRGAFGPSPATGGLANARGCAAGGGGGRWRRPQCKANLDSLRFYKCSDHHASDIGRIKCAEAATSHILNSPLCYAEGMRVSQASEVQNPAPENQSGRSRRKAPLCVELFGKRGAVQPQPGEDAADILRNLGAAIWAPVGRALSELSGAMFC